MMFDLNEKKFGGTVIFNNGTAGLVKDVEISVEKKEVNEPDTYPDYRLVASDGLAQVNMGFYYPKVVATKTDKENDAKAVMEVGRVMHIARAVMGTEYTFPSVSSAKEAFDTLFNLIKENVGGKKFNVFTTYGTIGYPSRFLGLRYFDFIEPADSTPSRLRAKAQDVLERLEADEPSDDGTVFSLEDKPTKKESWNL